VTKFDDDIDDFKKKVNQWPNMKRLDERATVRIARQWVGKIKEEIARGLSPLTRRKFPRYKNPDRYPGDRKPHQPVNLELTGKFLSDLKIDSVVTSGRDITVNLYYAGAKSPLIEQGHREGANGQPRRPTIPQGDENFSRFLTKEIESAYVTLIEKFDV
jgi:hypothetical protein